ncbi:hypothetical protein Val02_17550 [Virgisporangium aliadipatigenens]|uniref:Uncharacterized protein n=1 Tax=Virgisporangium aliadipatigenens TaxID=741659 RepID=A0A8J3YGP7_9ACTN|nr:hypothetical protein Val02_17550 [Virgisporangium aliadipatigenens]
MPARPPAARERSADVAAERPITRSGSARSGAAREAAVAPPTDARKEEPHGDRARVTPRTRAKKASRREALRTGANGDPAALTRMKSLDPLYKPEERVKR